MAKRKKTAAEAANPPQERKATYGAWVPDSGWLVCAIHDRGYAPHTRCLLCRIDDLPNQVPDGDTR